MVLRDRQRETERQRERDRERVTWKISLEEGANLTFKNQIRNKDIKKHLVQI